MEISTFRVNIAKMGRAMPGNRLFQCWLRIFGGFWLKRNSFTGSGLNLEIQSFENNRIFPFLPLLLNLNSLSLVSFFSFQFFLWAYGCYKLLLKKLLPNHIFQSIIVFTQIVIFHFLLLTPLQQLFRISCSSPNPLFLFRRHLLVLSNVMIFNLQ